MSGLSNKRPKECRTYRQQMSGTARIAALMLLLLMQPGPAVGQTDAEIEEVFWESVECESTGQVELYLEIYPTGRYVAEARTCLEGQIGLDRAARTLVQQGIASLGYAPGPADGQFGPATRAALRRWQTGKGFAGTGYLTREQAEALVAAGHQAVEEEEARQRQRAEAERREREREVTETQEAERRAREQRAEVERRAREMEELRARQAAQRAVCEAEVNEWPELDESQRIDLELRWQTPSDCLPDCVRTVQRPRECEAERAAYGEAKKRLDDYKENIAGQLVELGIALVTSGLSLHLHDEEESRKQSMIQAGRAMNECMSRATEEKNQMRTCMTRCCAEM